MGVYRRYKMYEYRLSRCGLRQAPEGTPGAVHDSIAAGTVGGFSNWAPGSPACPPPPPGRNAPSSGAVTRRYMMYEYGRYGMYEYGRYGMYEYESYSVWVWTLWSV